MEFNEDNFKVLGFCVLHYGVETLKEAISSVLPWCDHFLVLYSPAPSFGQLQKEPLPSSESMNNLHDICEELKKKSGKKFTWLRIQAYRESTHKDYAHDFAKKNGFDVSVCVDSDEVWRSGLDECLIKAFHGNYAAYEVDGFRHFYRNRAEYITDDSLITTRIFNYNNLVYNTGKIEGALINHYGYSVSEELMKYKLSMIRPHSGFYQTWEEYEKKSWDKNLYLLSDRDYFLHPFSVNMWKETTSL